MIDTFIGARDLQNRFNDDQATFALSSPFIPIGLFFNQGTRRFWRAHPIQVEQAASIYYISSSIYLKQPGSKLPTAVPR